MPLIQDWPTPVTFPEYKYPFEFTSIDIDLDGDPNDPNSSVNVLELLKSITTNATLAQGETSLDWSVTGEGALDVIMETAYKHLDAQFKSNRIKKEEYAQAFVQMYLQTLQLFSQSLIQFEIEKMRLKAQVAIENKRLELELQMSRERNESTERQQSLQIESSEKISGNQIISAEKQNTEQLASAEKQNQARIDAQAALVSAQVQTEIQKKHLHRRQIEGFDEDYKQKIYKIGLDSWAVGASIARDSFIGASYTPAAIGKASLDSLYSSFIIPDLDNFTYNRSTSTITST